MSYGPALLLRRLGLDTDRIIVNFFSKVVNQPCGYSYMVYLAHVATVKCVPSPFGYSYMVYLTHVTTGICVPSPFGYGYMVYLAHLVTYIWCT